MAHRIAASFIALGTESPIPARADRSAAHESAVADAFVDQGQRSNGPLDPPLTLSERDYRIGASDAKGRTERVWVRLPPYLVRLAQTLVNAGPYPWETPSDAFRFAIYWGLRWCKHNPPAVQTTFAQVQAMNDLLTHEQDQIAFRSVFDKARDVLHEYQREGAVDECRRVIAELDARINQMAEGYWQSRYRKALRDQFGTLMRGSAMPLMGRAEKEAQISGRLVVRPESDEPETHDDELSGDGRE